jgi:hypothetical protein
LSDAAAAWDALEEPWRACLVLAWSAYGAGTLPGGAALVDEAGTLVAEGRNPHLRAHRAAGAARGQPGAIVRCAIELARSMGLRIVAEGVESLEAHLWLAQMGCDEGQGYHYA